MTQQLTARPPAARTEPRRGLGVRALALVFVIAVTVRAVYCVLVLRGYAPISDASDYFEIAASLARGDGFAAEHPYGVLHRTAFRPPLYPLLLGSVFAVTGAHLGVAQAVNVLLGAVVVVLVAVIATRVGGRFAGVAAAALATVYPPLLANDGPPLAEPLSLVLVLGMVLVLLRERSGWVEWAGVLCGLLVLTRPSAQLLVPVLALWVLRRAGWRRALVFGAIAVLVIAPWVARNAAVFGHPVLVTSNGFNLAAVWSPTALAQGGFVDPVYDERFEPLRAAVDAEAAAGGVGNEGDLDAAFRQVGVAGLRDNLDQVPGVVGRNVVYLLDLSYRYDNGAERLDGRNLALRHAALPLVWIVSAVGAVTLVVRRRDPAVGLLLVCVGYFLLVSLVTVSPPRLRAPLDVCFVIGVGVALAALAAAFRRRAPA